MKKYFFPLVLGFLIWSCSDDDDNTMADDNPMVSVTCDDGIQNGDEEGVDCGGSACAPCITGVAIPATYVFERNGESTVSFSGQTTRLLMANEILSTFKDDTATQAQIDAMYDHQQDVMDFSDADLNASDKQVRNKTAGSYFFTQVAPAIASITI